MDCPIVQNICPGVVQDGNHVGRSEAERHEQDADLVLLDRKSRPQARPGHLQDRLGREHCVHHQVLPEPAGHPGLRGLLREHRRNLREAAAGRIRSHGPVLEEVGTPGGRGGQVRHLRLHGRWAAVQHW